MFEDIKRKLDNRNASSNPFNDINKNDLLYKMKLYSNSNDEEQEIKNKETIINKDIILNTDLIINQKDINLNFNKHQNDIKS
jgi:hypothetical protein